MRLPAADSNLHTPIDQAVDAALRDADERHAERLANARAWFARYYGLGTECRADRDGECTWSDCPQLRDGEPGKTGRHCPLDDRERT